MKQNKSKPTQLKKVCMVPRENQSLAKSTAKFLKGKSKCLQDSSTKPFQVQQQLFEKKFNEKWRQQPPPRQASALLARFPASCFGIFFGGINTANLLFNP